MFSIKVQMYLRRKAENWVSTFVLVGCVLITALLVFAAIKADALGDRFVEKNSLSSIESN